MIKQKSTNKKILCLLILIEGLAFFIHTIIESNFNMHIGELYFDLSPLKIFMSLTKQHHIISFGIFTILWLYYLFDKKAKYQKVFVGVFLFSVLVEITQIFFTEGHCRISDLFPNFLGITFSLAIFRLFEKLLNKPLFWFHYLLINLVLVIGSTLFSFFISQLFKEIIVHCKL